MGEGQVTVEIRRGEEVQEIPRHRIPTRQVVMVRVVIHM